LDNSYIKKICGDIAREVLINGAYYATIIEGTNSLVLQELPVGYCRSRYSVNNIPVIEFNMRFFDDKFPDMNYRNRVLKLFPADF
jgi:hypothetical protein